MKSKATSIVLKLLRSEQKLAEAKFARLFVRSVRVTQQTGWHICTEVGLTKNFVRMETS